MMRYLPLWAFFTCTLAASTLTAPAYADPLVPIDPAVYRQEATSSPDVQLPPLLTKAAVADVERARAVVNDAIAQAAVLNKARLQNPRPNRYLPTFGNISLKARDEAPRLLNVTDEMRRAAALVAEADAWSASHNGTVRPFQRRAARPFWLGAISHMGGWPFGKNSKNYKVFRNVKAYGAVGDGLTDDTEAIRRAVMDGNACGPGCYSSTTKGAIIYFPPGVYLVSGTIETYYGTQFIGDVGFPCPANNRPVIKAASSFVGLGVISTDKYVENGGAGPDGSPKQWFINTANFYRQIRNFVIDIRDTRQDAYIAALHYQVAQATSLQFVEFKASTAPGTTQQAIFAENGSGGYISDLVFNGGAFGIYGGAQQFTAQRLTFNNVRTAVQLVWDWGWSWSSIQVNNCGTGFKLIGETPVSNTGSVIIVDSAFTDVETAVLINPATTEIAKGTTGVVLDNVKFTRVGKGIVATNNAVYVPGNKGSIITWAIGRVYKSQRLVDRVSNELQTQRNPLMLGSSRWGLPTRPYFERAKPQYEGASPDDFVHMQPTCRGDGVSDDTTCFQQMLNANAGRKIIYVDAGSYILTDTINVPSDARIVGENWAQLVAKGPNFEDSKKPRPLLRVGRPGDSGTAELQDLIFTSKGPTAGAVFVEWNVHAASPGATGMWDCHVRVGGAVGTDLESYQCPASTTATNTGCSAGSMLMHVTKKASGYFENVWLWVADHDIDDPDWKNDNNSMTQTSVYVARGVLIESTAPSWYYGTASEHAVFYQYALLGAKNVHMSMIQTESAYYQPNPKPPHPFSDVVSLFPGDPNYHRCGQDGEPCDAGWGLRIQKSSQVTVYGAGLYSWFQNYAQTCLQTMNCQTSMVKLEKNAGNVSVYNLVTIGSTNMIYSDKDLFTAKDNQAVSFHPRWSQIAFFAEKDMSQGRH